MYYKVSYSVEPKVIGNVNSQTEDSLDPHLIDGQLFSKDIFLKKVEDPSTVLTPTAILTKKAKLTDVIGGSSTAIVGQMMISNRLKVILEDVRGAKIQFFPLSVIHNEIVYSNYWVMCAYNTDMEYINYTQSKIELLGMGLQKIKDVSVSGYQHFNSLVNEVKLPERLLITKVSLVDQCSKDLLVLRWVEGGIGFYVSEKIKCEIEKSNCTGIELSLI